MRTPAIAFAWELWRRNRRRLIAVLGVLLGFALLYPRLCALAGFNPDAADGLDELLQKTDPMLRDQSSPLWRLHFMYLGFLSAGPGMAMFLSLLCLLWMFTYIEFKPNTQDPVAFPTRIFSLPISTSFLFSWLFLSGVASVALLYGAWVHLVSLPQLGVYNPYQTCQRWLTLLVLAQGLVWALASWPTTRFLLVTAAFVGILGDQSWEEKLSSPILLPVLFLVGAGLGRIGLEKMRHGEWQGWTWKRALPSEIAPVKLRGPERFSSPAQAQLWFEWRRFARTLCLFVALLTIVPVVLHLLAWVALGFRPIQENTLFVFTLCLAAVPLFIHFCHSLSPARSDQSFMMIRPITTGEMAMAVLKATALSTIFSSILAFVAICALPLLNHFQNVNLPGFLLQDYKAPIVIALIFLTWRIVAVNSWSKRFAGVPFLALLAACVMPVLVILDQSDLYSRLLQRALLNLPTVLGLLLAAKLLLALFAFRECLNRRLLSRSAMTSYLVVWVVLVACLFTLVQTLAQFPKEWMLPVILGIVLAVPLGRIALTPIALSRERHE